MKLSCATLKLAFKQIFHNQSYVTDLRLTTADGTSGGGLNGGGLRGGGVVDTCMHGYQLGLEI